MSLGARVLRCKPASVALFAGVALLLDAAPALGYCRTTTCDPRKEQCGVSGGCPTKGLPVFWRGRCVSYSVQSDASPLQSISLRTAEDVIGAALRAWTGATCGPDTTPSIQTTKTPPVTCAEATYNEHDRNANVWVFRDQSWPHTGALALATLTFDLETGEILDADVELNSSDNAFTAADADIGVDLQSVVTHEAGHFLGLAHSLELDASMWPGYLPGETKLRSLSADDIAGICDVYPPGRTATASCDPRNGFASECSADGGTAVDAGNGDASDASDARDSGDATDAGGVGDAGDTSPTTDGSDDAGCTGCSAAAARPSSNALLLRVFTGVLGSAAVAAARRRRRRPFETPRDQLFIGQPP